MNFLQWNSFDFEQNIIAKYFKDSIDEKSVWGCGVSQNVTYVPMRLTWVG